MAQDWSETVTNPIPASSTPGQYDAVTAASPIGLGDQSGGFAVSYDWTGQSRPGSQYYEIIDPDKDQVIDSGWTVPEPAMLALLGLGAMICRKKRG